MLNKVNLWLEKLINVILKPPRSCENVMNICLFQMTHFSPVRVRWKELAWIQDPLCVELADRKMNNG